MGTAVGDVPYPTSRLPYREIPRLPRKDRRAKTLWIRAEENVIAKNSVISHVSPALGRTDVALTESCGEQGMSEPTLQPMGDNGLGPLSLQV